MGRHFTEQSVVSASSVLAPPPFLASCVDWSVTRDAVPPMWNGRIVSRVPGSPIDCAAMTPTAQRAFRGRFAS
jgi:hypothetical protein